jgi:multidrug efflux pump subunit AcrA (membrane-fusion protein)
MRFLTRSLVAVVLAALALGLLAMGAGVLRDAVQARAERTQMPRMARERIFAARVVTVTPGDIAPVLAVHGEIRARRSLDIRAPMAGRVLDLPDGIESGAAVAAGQVLLRLDPSDAQAARDLLATDRARLAAEQADATRALDLAQQDRAEAEAQVDLRQRALDRRLDLAQRGVATEAAVEEAELALASARAALIARRQAEAQAETRLDLARSNAARVEIQLAEAERRLADTVVTASFDGVLSDVSVVAGGLVAGNERLARLIDPQALEVAFRVSTAQYLRLIDEAGALRATTGEADLDTGGQRITAPLRLTRVAPMVGEGQTGREMFAAITAPAPGLRPGDFVTLRLAEPVMADVAQLPATAVDADGQVLVLGQGERLETARVSIVRRQGETVLVRAPELTGREVVALRQPYLGAGIRIRPQRDAAAGAAVPDEPEMVELDAERRAALIARVESNAMMPEQARTRILTQLQQDRVPAQLIERLEQGRRGG